MSIEEEYDVYEECKSFIKFCREQSIPVTSEAVAIVWAEYQSNIDFDDIDEE